MLALLSACGGGDEEPSNFFTDTAGNTDSGESSNDNSFNNIVASITADQVIASGGESSIYLTTFVGDSGREGEIAPNVPLRITVHPAGVASLVNAPSKTDRNGDASFSVTHPSDGNVVVNISSDGNIQGGLDIPLYFGATAAARLITPGTVPADGVTPAEIQIFVRDWEGKIVPNIPIELSFPISSFAVPTITNGATDENGEFIAGVTNTVPQVTKVTPIAGGSATNSLVLTYGGGVVTASALETVDLIIKSNNVAANGTTTANIVIVARDLVGTPVPYVPVSIASDSATAILSTDAGTTNSSLFSTGNTGETGSVELQITNTVEEIVNITASTNSQDTQIGNSAAIVFIVGADSDNLAIKLNEPLNNRQSANGTDTVHLRGQVTDKEGNPLSNQIVSIIVDGGSAIISDDNPETDASGRFFVFFTDEFAETFTAKAVIGDTSSNEVQIRFVNVPADRDGDGEIDVAIGSINLIASPNQQVANGNDQVTLTAIIRDVNSTPISGINVSIVTPSATAIFDVGQVATGSGGTAVFKMSNTVNETVNITAKAEGKSSSPVSIQFVSRNADKLYVNVINDMQLANGADAIQIDVIARDNNNNSIDNVPIVVRLSTSAIANPSNGVTDENGYFSTSITSTQAGDMEVVIGIEGSTVAASSADIEFLAQSGADAQPDKVDLIVIPEKQQIANGNSKFSLTVIPRNINDTPLTEVDVELITNSSNIIIPSGITNSLGQYQVFISSEIAEVFTVTPVVNGIVMDNAIQILEFTAVGEEVADLTVNVFNDNQPADGASNATLNIIARDSGGKPVEGVPIVIQAVTGEIAIVSPSRGVTDADGFFSSQVTSTQAGEVYLTVAVEGTEIAVSPTVVKFFAQTGASPDTVELKVINAPQPADGLSEINLVVIPRDIGNTPIGGVNVELIPESDQITLAQTTGTTNALGEFHTTVTTTEDLTETLAGTLIVNITPVAEGLIGEATPVIFIPVTVNIPKTLTLNILDNNQDTGQEVILRVLARDDNNFPMENVLVSLSTQAIDFDVTGSVVFGSNSFRGITDSSGIFETTVTNTSPGGFEVTAAVLGRDGIAILSSNTATITFNAAATDQIKEVSAIRLVADKPQLSTDGLSEGIIITAIVKNKENNLVEGAVVSFSADQDGEIQIIQGTTDVAGIAQARLTTVGNLDNRTIIVKANVSSTTGEILSDNIEIRVVGTSLSISGPTSIIKGDEVNFIVSLLNVDGDAIPNQVLAVISNSGNKLNHDSPEITVTTDINGQANISFVASVAGEDIIKVSKPSALDIDEATISVTISDDKLDIKPIEPNIIPKGWDCPVIENCTIPLNESQRFEIKWTRDDAPVSNGEIMISTNRGTTNGVIVPIPPITDPYFEIESNNTGTANVIVRGEREDGQPGPAVQFNIKFLATNPAEINVQANPAVIGVNPIGADTERSEIIAVVRDPQNNLVAEQRVNFVLDDVTGGRLTEGSVITDDFGRATTTYIAGPTSSAANGVKVTAKVANTNKEDSVSFTVAENDLFVILGTGNKLEPIGGFAYKVFHSVLVTDSNGSPINETEVKISIYPSEYKSLGIVSVDEDGLSIYGVVAVCKNEDENRNGILDLGEDSNNNGMLEPGNVLTTDALTLITGQENPFVSEPPPPGFAFFNINYAIQYAYRVEADITARTQVAGTEGIDTISFTATCEKGDADEGLCPTGDNPFDINLYDSSGKVISGQLPSNCCSIGDTNCKEKLGIN